MPAIVRPIQPISVGARRFLSEFALTLGSMSQHGDLAIQVEQGAISLLRQVLGERASIIDLSNSQSYDFEIRYKDGRIGIGEAGLLANRDYEAAWAALKKRKENHVFRLPAGHGTWSTQLHRQANINKFERAVGSIISDLNELGVDNFQVGMHYQLSDIDSRCKELGIQHLHKNGNYSEDQIIYFLDLVGSIFIDDTLDSLVQSLEGHINHGLYKDSWQKLEKFQADEKHLFLQCGSLIDLNHQQVLLKTNTAPHIPEICFPLGVTDIWVVPTYLEAYSIHWSRNGERNLIDPVKKN